MNTTFNFSADLRNTLSVLNESETISLIKFYQTYFEEFREDLQDENFEVMLVENDELDEEDLYVINDIIVENYLCFSNSQILELLDYKL